jgi:hypothetical protein
MGGPHRSHRLTSEIPLGSSAYGTGIGVFRLGHLPLLHMTATKFVRNGGRVAYDAPAACALTRP